MQENSAPAQNAILAALPAFELQTLLSLAKRVPLNDKQLIYDQERPVDAVYFPLMGAISMLNKTGDGNAVEASVVGKVGFVGLPVLFDGETSFAEALVQVPGQALRLPAASLAAQLGGLPRLTALLLRYAHLFTREVLISNGCNRFHSAEARISRWLLSHRDHTQTHVFPFTHEFLAYLLGAQRSTVSQVTGELQKKGLIRYSYGEMAIVDQVGLEAASCECFAKERQEREGFLQFIERTWRAA